MAEAPTPDWIAPYDPDRPDPTPPADRLNSEPADVQAEDN